MTLTAETVIAEPVLLSVLSPGAPVTPHAQAR